MNTGAVITIIVFLAIVVLAAFFSIRLGWHEEKCRQKKQEKAAQIALRCNPAYAQMEERDRAYHLAQQRQTVELAIKQADFQLKQYLALHRIPDQFYSINEEIRSITAFPRFPPIQKDRALLAGTALLVIPPAYDLLDIFSSSDITPNRIFLGKDSHGLLFVPSNQLHHAAFSASTGYGKTTLVRGIISQLLHIGHHVIIADLKYADVTEKGEDWRPIAARIFSQPPLEIA